MGKDLIIIEKSSKKSKAIFWMFFGIIGFIAIYFPFFGPNLRYKTGSYISNTFNTLGTILVTIGALMMIWGLFTLFCGRAGGGVKMMLLGFVILFIGGWFLAPSLIGSTSTGREVPQGYH